MKTWKYSQKGFSVIEGLLIVIILGIISGTGYYVWNAQKQTNDTLNGAASVSQNAPANIRKSTSSQANSNDPYQNWKTFNTTYSKVSFMYPYTWKLQDLSINGHDVLELSGANGFRLSLNFSDLGHPTLDFKPTVRFAKEAIFNGRFDGNGKYSFNTTQEFLDFVGGTPAQDKDGLVYEFVLSKSDTNALDSPSCGKFWVVVTGRTAKPETVAVAKTDSDYQNAALLIASLNATH